MRLQIDPFKDPAPGLDWPEQYPRIEEEWREYLSQLPEAEIDFRLRETYIPLGVDMPSMTIEILKLAGYALSIPAAHKIVRETVAEWRKIWKNIQRVRDWIEDRTKITSYSKEVAFIAALAHLDENAPVDELELVSHQEIIGNTDSPEPSFETAGLVYYIFTFRHTDSYLYIVVVDSRLNVVNEAALPLDPRTARPVPHS